MEERYIFRKFILERVIRRDTGEFFTVFPPNPVHGERIGEFNCVRDNNGNISLEFSLYSPHFSFEPMFSISFKVYPRLTGIFERQIFDTTVYPIIFPRGCQDEETLDNINPEISTVIRSNNKRTALWGIAGVSKTALQGENRRVM